MVPGSQIRCENMLHFLALQVTTFNITGFGLVLGKKPLVLYTFFNVFQYFVAKMIIKHSNWYNK